MRKPLVQGLELNTSETLELSSAPKQASPPLTLATLAAYENVLQYSNFSERILCFIENDRPTSLGSKPTVVLK